MRQTEVQAKLYPIALIFECKKALREMRRSA